MTSLSSSFFSGVERVRKYSVWFLMLGILLVVLGLVCVGEAQSATTFSILVLGWVLSTTGAIWLLNAFWARSWHGFFLYLLNGIVRGVTGYLLIRHPDAGAAGITLLLASLFLVGGVFRMAAASAIQFPRWGWTVFSGLISVILGLSLLIIWPAASGYFVGLAIGVDLSFDGAALVGFASAIRASTTMKTLTSLENAIHERE